MLLLSYYFYIIRINAFLSGSFAVFIVSISLNLFFKDKKFLYFVGFFIQLIFFLNPSVVLYFILLIFCFIISCLFFLNRKNYKLYLGVVLISFIIFSCLFLPYLLILSKYNFYLNDLIRLFFNSVFSFSAQITRVLIPSNSFFIILFQETTGLIQNFIDFIFSGSILKEFNVAFNTMVIFGIFISFGFLKRGSKNVGVSNKEIHFICKIAILIIFTLYFLIMFTSYLSKYFILRYADRIFEMYYPFIILLCGFGIEYLMNLTGKIINKIRHKIKNLKFSFKSSFKLKHLLVFSLILIIISNLLSQAELKEKLNRHFYDDDTMNSFLFMRATIPKYSTILMPKLTNDSYLFNDIFFDMDIQIANKEISHSFFEFESLIKKNSIKYLLLNKTAYTSLILNNLSILPNYEFLFENEQYIIYKITTRINFPVNGEVFNRIAPDFEVEFTDGNIDSMWYTIDNGITNITFIINGTIDQEKWTDHTDGSVTLIFYANDTAGVIRSAQVIIIKDTVDPSVSINSPSSGKVFNRTAPYFEVEITDDNLDTMWYTIDNGVTNITFNINDTIDPGKWTYHDNGIVTLIFYANDTVGNIGTAQIIITKDSVDPGTYSFNDDTIGGDPAGWTVGESGGTINVIAEMDDHKKVVELDDAGLYSSCGMTQTFTAGGQSEGTVELWLKSDDVSKNAYIFLWAGGIKVISIQSFSQIWRAYYGAAWDTLGTALDNVWYHFRIYFYDDSGTTKLSVWLDSTQVVSDETALDNGDVTHIGIFTSKKYSVLL